jgi:hypothetical protein
MTKLTVLLIALTLGPVTGCESYVHGNGVFGEDTRSVPAFDGVSIGLGIVATVRAGATDRSVTLSGDENVLQYIETDVSDGVLKTSLSGIDGYDTVHQVQLVIATPELVYVKAWGDSNVTATSIEAASFTAIASEGSSVTLASDSAVATTLALTGSGTSTISAVDYEALDATVILSGGSHAAVFVSGTVAGSLSEGSTVAVYGGGSCSFTPPPGTACDLIIP